MGKILVVGEEGDIRRLLAEDLAGEGNIVAVTGTPALIEEELFSFEPDMILLDFRLNRMDQWAVLDEVKRGAPQVPVLPFTSYLGREENGGNLETAARYLEAVKQQVLGILEEKEFDRLILKGATSPEGKPYLENPKRDFSSSNFKAGNT